MELTQSEFRQLRDHVYALCGLAIADNKQYLIQQRLKPLAIEAGCSSFTEYRKKALSDMSGQESERIINAITTNETSFFRDTHPFQMFGRYILPQLAEVVAERQKAGLTGNLRQIKIWSVASSTGEEPYSIAMVIDEFTRSQPQLGISNGDFHILATDISTQVLEKAIAGVYTGSAIRRGISPERQMRYIVASDGHFQVNKVIRQMIEFRQLNLMRSFSHLGTFDVIFCRNVLIYFDQNTQSRIYRQFHRMITNQGALILGSSENTYQVTNQFASQRLGNSLVYRKV